MSLLDFQSSSPTPKGGKKSLKLVLGIGALAGVITLSSTLAASINLNGGDDVEFGQGVLTTTACDDDGITLTPYSTFYNDSQDADFYFSSLEIAGVSDNCSGVTFKVRAYMNGNDNPLFWPADPNGDSFEFGFIVNGDWTQVDSCMLLNSQVTGGNPNNNSVLIDWTNCVPENAEFAGSIDRITIESSVNPNSGVFPLQVGDIGPGGGRIFYVASTPFDCGPTLDSSCTYLEVASTTATTNPWTDATYIWSGNTTEEIGANAQGTAIGTGYKNTLAIVRQASGGDAATKAGTISRAYRGPNNLMDWYLPSKDELNQLYLAKTTVGVATGDYWSSTEDGTSDAWRQFFGNGYQGSVNKNNSNSVRPVRAF
jgi:hypothetical protein